MRDHLAPILLLIGLGFILGSIVAFLQAYPLVGIASMLAGGGIAAVGLTGVSDREWR